MSTSTKNNSPILSAILNASVDILPYVLQYNFSGPPGRDYFKENQAKLLDGVASSPEPSCCPDDYFPVEPGHTQLQEKLGSENSLFLAIARSLLFKMEFEKRNYECALRDVYFSDVDFIAHFNFDSDLALQEVLRKKLCLFWMNNVANYNSSRYKCNFANVCDFVYQVYQIGVNNFSQNSLFSWHALQDLATILNIKIYVFRKNSHKNDTKLIYSANEAVNKDFIIYEPLHNDSKQKTNDSIFLHHDATANQFKWLMPKSHKTFIENNLLKPSQALVYFKTNPLYYNRMLIINSLDLHKYFGDEVLNNLSLLLFIIFLNECPVHTLVSVHDLSFDMVFNSKDPNDMIFYLNSIWGQTHFNLKETKMKMDYLENQKSFIASEKQKQEKLNTAKVILRRKPLDQLEIDKTPNSSPRTTPRTTHSKSNSIMSKERPPISPNLRRRSNPVNLRSLNQEIYRNSTKEQTLFYQNKEENYQYLTCRTNYKTSCAVSNSNSVSQNQQQSCNPAPKRKRKIITELNRRRSDIISYLSLANVNNLNASSAFEQPNPSSYGSFIDHININSTSNNNQFIH